MALRQTKTCCAGNKCKNNKRIGPAQFSILPRKDGEPQRAFCYDCVPKAPSWQGTDLDRRLKKKEKKEKTSGTDQKA